MSNPQTTNTDRAGRGAAALANYTRNAKQAPPISAEGIASLARLAAEQHAQAAGIKGLREQAETSLSEAGRALSNVVSDVLHHMDGAISADVLITAGWHVYGLHTGERTGAVALCTCDDQTGDAVEFLAALCHAAVTLDEDPIDMLARGLGHFEHEAETERLAHVQKARTARLTT